MIKKLITLKMWVLSVALTGVLFSCAKNSDDSGNTDDKTMYITVNMPAENNGVATRVGAVDEVAIKQAYVIVYGAGAVGADTPKFTSKVELTDITDGEVNTKKILAFKPADNIAEGDEINIIFNKAVENLAIPKKDMLSALKLTSISDGLVSLSAGLPMYGRGVWTAAGSPLIAIKRSVAKVQLKLDYNGNLHVPGSMGSRFTTANTTYKLYQLSDVGSIDGINNSVISSTGSEVVTEISAGAEINEPSSQMLKDNNDNYVGANYIYAYPYSVKSIGNPTAALENKMSSIKRIAMIMKNTGGGETTYHRLDFFDKGGKKFLDILNNHHYIVKIRKVSPGGYATATDALNKPASNVEFDIIVEEEGTVIVSNGQYALNVNELGDEFKITDTATTIELAQVSRQTSVNAPMADPTSFSVTLERALSINGDISIKLVDVPSELNSDVKSIKIVSSGTGVAIFRYNAILGNITHTSKFITLKSEGGVITLEGFSPDAGNLNGYSVSRKFNVSVGAGYKYKVSSSFKQEWDASLTRSLPTTLPTKFTTSQTTASLADITPSSGVQSNVYLNIYRTAPDDADITGLVNIIATASDNSVCQHSFEVKVTTSCKLPTVSDNYSIQIGGVKVADRNAGSAMPSSDNPLASKNFTSQSDHPDFIAGAIGCPIPSVYYEWEPQNPVIAAIAGPYYAFSSEKGMANALVACDNQVLGSETNWRLPDEDRSNIDEISLMKTQVRHSKNRAFFLSTVKKTIPSDGTTPAFNEYTGVFIPFSGYAHATFVTGSALWSGVHSSNSAHRLSVSVPPQASLDTALLFYGISARCVV